MSGSAGKSKSTTKPVDMTPAPFKALQTPFASVLAGLLGFQQAPAGAATSGSAITAGTPATGTTAPAAGTKSPQYTGPFNVAQGSGQPAYRGGVQGGSAPPGTHSGHIRTASGLSGNQGMAQPAANPFEWVASAGGPGFANQLLDNFFKYEGPTTAALGANEQTLLDRLMGQQDGSIKSASQSFLEGMLGEDPSAINPFLSAAIEAAQRPTFQALEETLSRTLPGRFTQAGQFINPQGSSAFDRAAALAARDSQQTAADIATNLSFSAYDADQNRRLDAAKSLPGVTKQEIDTTIANLQAQALPRLIQEMGIERGMELFQNRVNGLLTTLGITAGVTAPTIASESSSKSSQTSFGLK